jgi:two-component system, chemotaxis family, sensor kinase CheA
MYDESIINVFRDEAREIIEGLEVDLVAIEKDQDDQAIHRIFRGFHTLKGGSGMVGLDAVAELTHHAESRLADVRNGKERISRKLIDILLESIDWTRNAIFNGDNDPDKMKQIREKLSAPESKSAAVIPSEKNNTRYFRIGIGFRVNIFFFGIDPLLIIRDLAKMGEFCEFNVIKKEVPPFHEMDPEKCYLSWNVVIKTGHSREEIDAVFVFVKDDNPVVVEDITRYFNDECDDNNRVGDILIRKGIIGEQDLGKILEEQQNKNVKVGELVMEKGLATRKEIEEALVVQDKVRKQDEGKTIRVDANKIDEIMNLLGEIVIGQSALSKLVSETDDHQGQKIKGALYSLDRATRDFQERILSIRMVQIGSTFSQFQRFVRDTARQLGKEIRLEISGGETELDKTVIEKIIDPLKHMIRNAIDHGLEPSEERTASGKSAEGTISLSAYHFEGNVCIEISDDGRGLDLERIREKGIEKGLVRSGEELSVDKIANLIFAPGLSTAHDVGKLSGRGVGMDVVKNNIAALRGSIKIESSKGKGTRFRIKLPLTMAIIEGMLFKSGDSVFIVPLLSIIESIRPKKEDIQTIEGKSELVHVRKEFIPLVRLYRSFGINPQHDSPWEGILIIVESSGTKIALMVDELIGQQQVVIKSMDQSISQEHSVSGAAILGDGTVALILDVNRLFHGMGGHNEQISVQ